MVAGLPSNGYTDHITTGSDQVRPHAIILSTLLSIRFPQVAYIAISRTRGLAKRE